MGNCQAAEVAAAVVQHPGGSKVDRFYWPVTAQQVMASNPGNYVALLVVASASSGDGGGGTMNARKQLKLLRPDDSLVLGHVYCLISFEDVLKEFAAKKCVKLGKMVKHSGALGLEYYDHTKNKKKSKEDFIRPEPNSYTLPKSRNFSPVQVIQLISRRTFNPKHVDSMKLPGPVAGGCSSSRANVRGVTGSSLRGGWLPHTGTPSGGRWRPTLQSISEVGN